MRRTQHLLLGCAGLALFLAAGSASAADPKFLGYLSGQSGQIWAYPDASGRWCRDDAALSVLLTPQLSYAQVEKGLHAIGSLLVKECPAAVSAKIAAYNPDRSIAGPSFSVTRDNNWVVAAAAPVAPVAAPTAPAPAQPAAAPTGEAPQQAAAPVVAPVAAPVVAPQPVPLPRDLDYWSAMLRDVRDNPALQQDNGTLRAWAFHRYENEYRQFQNQEFKLQPLLDRASADLSETLAHGDPDHVTLVLNTQFGSYDFNNHRFPLEIGSQLTTNRPCCFQGGPPTNFEIKLTDSDAIVGLPMSADEAQAFTERRTRYGSVNRSLAVAITIKLDHAGFQNSGWGNSVALGTVDGLAFYNDNRLGEPLYQVGQQEFEKWRAAKAAEKAIAAQAQAEREAEIRRQQLLAQREQNIRAFATASTSVKLANFISDGDLNAYLQLDNLRNARASALISGKAVSVSMLVQADGRGRSQVATKWPGKLELTLGGGQPDLKSSEWYLVRGLMTVPEAGALPPAQLMAQQVYACTQPKCADATDATTIIDRKLAGAH